MAITLNCSCGKVLKVDEKHRGKKAKCPECGATLVVEEQEQETAVSEKPKKHVPVPDDDDDERGGTAVKSGKPSRRADPDDDDDDDPAPRKPIKKKAAKSNMMMYLIGGGCGGLLLLSCCGGIIGGAVWYFLFRSSAEDLKYVQDGDVGFFSVRAADLWKNATLQDQMNAMPGGKADFDKKLKEMEGKFGMKITDLERMTIVVRSFDIMNPEVAMIFKTTAAMNAKKIVETISKESNDKEKEVKHEGLTLYVWERKGEVCFVSDRIAVAAEKEATLKAVLTAKRPAKNAALTRGIQMASSGNHQIVAAFEVKKDLLDKVMGGGRRGGMGGGDLKLDNLKQLNGFIFAAAVAKDVAMEAIVTFDNKDVAAKAKSEVDGLVGTMKIGVGNGAPAMLTKFLDTLKVEQSGVEVNVKGRVDPDFKGLGPMFGPFGPGFGGGPGGGGGPVGGGGFGNPQRMTSLNNLKQIGLAMHNFHDVNKTLPNHAIRHPQTGASLLSWRVSLLPYLEEGGLYNQIKKDEPWDSAFNRQFWNRIPRAYQLPGRPIDGRTNYQVFHGNETPFPKSKKPANLGSSMVGDIRMTGIPDGTSNTFMVVEAANSVNWMAPDDIPFQMNQQGLLAGRLGNHWGNNTFCAAFCDGSAKALRRTANPMTLQACITRAGGEVINFQDIQE